MRNSEQAYEPYKSTKGKTRSHPVPVSVLHIGAAVINQRTSDRNKEDHSRPLKAFQTRMTIGWIRSSVPNQPAKSLPVSAKNTAVRSSSEINRVNSSATARTLNQGPRLPSVMGRVQSGNHCTYTARSTLESGNDTEGQLAATGVCSQLGSHRT